MYLDTGHDFRYSPGQAINIDPHQFIELESALKQRELSTGRREYPRGFSLSSSPLDEYISLTIKVEQKHGTIEPLLTPFLRSKIDKGDRLEISGPYGTYKLPDNYGEKGSVVYINAGSGIAPSHGIWNYLASNSPRIKQFLLFQVRTRNDIIYRDEIYTLNKQEVLKSQVYLSRDGYGDEICRGGYIDLEEFVGLHGDMVGHSLFFVCGPNRVEGGREGFRDSCVSRLKSLGVPDLDIITESW